MNILEHVFINGEEFKYCTKCNQLKSVYAFGKRKSSKDGLRHDCKECIKEYNKEYKSDNKEKVNQQHKIYMGTYKTECKDKLREYDKQYYKNHSKEIIKRKRIYQIKNAKKIKAYKFEYDKKYRKLNADKIKEVRKEWIKNNIDQVRELKKIAEHKRRNRLRKITAKYSIKDWELCKEYFNNTCAYCGKEIKLTQDHFIPVSKDGEYTKNNVIPACLSCNSGKCNKDFFEWYSKQEFYSKEREAKILKYLHYDKNKKIQQLALTV